MSKIIEIIDSDDDNHISIDKHATTPSTSTTSNNMEAEGSPQLQSRRRRRKSILHVMNDPDMQFQTIAVDDDDDDEEEINLNKTVEVNYHQRSPINKPNAAAVRPILKAQKSSPKILTSKGATCEDMVDAAYDKYLNDPETISDIYAIAEERTRINYLLNLNGMPEISFSLHTHLDRLQFQLEERLKQRKLLQNWDNNRVQENRRSFLQNNTEQNIQ